MRFSTKGIGWLIAGLLICCSMTEAGGVAGAVGTLGIGCVFIAIYFMRQRFRPKGIGWFIVGGLFAAFCLEEMMLILSGSSYAVMDDLSTIFIGLIAALIFFFIFYRRNKEYIDDYADSIPEDNDEFEFPYQEEVFREETVEAVNENAAEDEVEDILDIEITDDE